MKTNVIPSAGEGSDRAGKNFAKRDQILRFRYTSLRMAIIAAASLLLAGCLRDNADITSPVPDNGPDDKQTALIGLTVPGMKTPTATRALDSDQEKAVREVDLLIVGNATGTLLEWRHIASGINTSSTNGIDYEFRVTGIENSANITVILIANAGVEVANALSVVAGTGSWIGADKKAFLAALQMIAATKWNTDTAAANWQLPMYGEVSISGSIYAAALPTIPLTRMHAKVDIINAATADFTLAKVHVVNYNTRGLVSPAWNATTGVVSQTVATAANLPSDPATCVWADGNQLTYTPTSATKIEGEIYLFESNALYDAADDPAEHNPTVPPGKLRLVVEGTYAGATYWYPVDFTYDAADADATKYMPVLRNHRYVFTITAAEGRGYTSLADAVASQTVISNLRTRVIWYDESVIRDMVFDGQYMLGVDAKEITLTREKQEAKVQLFADNPAGWGASIDNPAANTWLRFKDDATTVSGNPELTDFTLSVAVNNTGAARTATITLTSGRLTMGVTVTQTTASGYSIRITDADGNELNELVFGYGLIDEITAQQFYVVWDGADECAVVRTTDIGDTAFEYAADSDQPGGTITGGVKIYSVRAEKTDDYNSIRESTLTFTVTDDAGNIISRDLPLRQAETVLETQITPTAGYSYVGAFWRAGQTGERVIRIPVAAAYKGGFVVRVIDYGGFGEDDIVFDDKSYATYPLTGDAEDSDNAVTGTSMTYGTVDDTGGNIAFRIGLAPTATLASPDAAPRYAVAAIFYKYNGATHMQKLYLRQGEAADYVMAPNDPYGPDTATGAPADRPLATKFLPYNLTHPTLKATATATERAVAPIQPTPAEDYLTSYPTQAGGLYQFATTGRHAYNPVCPVTDIPSGYKTTYNTTYWSTLKVSMETCPEGYRRPHDGAINAAVASPAIKDSEMRQSLWYNPQLSADSNVANMVMGNYADGFFDRRPLQTQTSWELYGKNTAVSINNSHVAYFGGLVFNPVEGSSNHNASLFFPAAGLRIHSHGRTGWVGYAAAYVTASSAANNKVWQFNLQPNQLMQLKSTDRAAALSVRCVVDPDYVAPPNPSEFTGDGNVPITTYVGAFWKASQRGERLIRIDLPADDASNTYSGKWAVHTLDYGSGFSDGDILFQSWEGTPPEGVNEPDTNVLTAGKKTLDGSVSDGGTIAFKIGLNSTYTAATGKTDAQPVRYARVLVRFGTKDGEKYGYNRIIYIRQGEDADYVMTKEDLNPDGSAFTQDRMYAKKWLAYNLTTDGDITSDPYFYTGVATNGAIPTSYPTQAGAIWQFASSNARFAYSPIVGVIAGAEYGSATWNRSANAGSYDASIETCPNGYRRPNTGGDNTPVNSECYHSLIATDGQLMDNSTWGYYADGYFDRYTIVSSPTGVRLTAVNPLSVNVGYIGRLFFNPIVTSTHYNASLFFPASGTRSDNSTLLNTGVASVYLSTSNYSINKNSQMNLQAGGVSPAVLGLRCDGASIRCVAE